MQLTVQKEDKIENLKHTWRFDQRYKEVYKVNLVDENGKNTGRKASGVYGVISPRTREPEGACQGHREALDKMAGVQGFNTKKVQDQFRATGHLFIRLALEWKPWEILASN